MKSTISIILIALSINAFTQNSDDMDAAINPLLSEFNTPFGVPPFDQIKTFHFLPAFSESIIMHDSEIDKIVSNQEEPTFENTIAAYDNSGIILSQVKGVFYNLTSANTSPEMQEIARTVAPLLSKHSDDIMMNAALFNRIDAIYNNERKQDLTKEQYTFLDKLYKEFVRKGAKLDDDHQNELRKINQELSLLSLEFGDNILAETNAWKMVIENKKKLSGLPPAVIAAAAEEAKLSGYDKKWVFTVQKPSMIPFLQYADNRELREEIHKAYTMRGDNNNEYDNKEVIRKITGLRLQKARLLGYETHAHYILEKNMAGDPDQVYNFLNELMEAALPVARQEAEEIQGMMGDEKTLEPWDWWYYAEKIRKERYDLDEESLRPYFELDNVQKGLFEVVRNLYGLQFDLREDFPTYHKDARAFEVSEANGNHVGVLYMDFFPRPSKRGGAWMNSYRKQSMRKGNPESPVITTVFNFTKPSGDAPALLSLDEVNTMFHEMGHALHGLLSKCTYHYVSGTSVPRDFVELPSQIMENWATEPEVLKSFAIHYETGEAIPDELIEKITASGHFNQGFAMVEYLSASFLDMDWHTITESADIDINSFETASMERIHMLPEIVVRYRSTYFNHIFAGGYSSGYYSYLWAEVLDADAFEAFREFGLFDESTAMAFRTSILEKGGGDNPMDMYVNFRGKKPSKEALLKKRGIQ